MSIPPWSGDDRRALKAWLGSNPYRVAFLCASAPMKPSTLDRILRAYHDPAALLSARLRDLMARYPAGVELPHDRALING